MDHERKKMIVILNARKRAEWKRHWAEQAYRRQQLGGESFLRRRSRNNIPKDLFGGMS